MHQNVKMAKEFWGGPTGLFSEILHESLYVCLRKLLYELNGKRFGQF